ncbi:hypothetical protein PV08_08292 [Exophiala spinifera]|uniref:C2H2-type domain-containing protein n=1 Tax=Exophiala spinifera TaxID=91928 RepID=A0A0D2B3B2_9EURO|nr:uncharacterized protein PV08_08292 [Exophiala spinifera]KIW13105.1 hypothetical protein PV08_08292 [Exophiala spinifera]
MSSINNLSKRSSVQSRISFHASPTTERTVEDVYRIENLVTKGGGSEIAYVFVGNGHFTAVPIAPQSSTDDTDDINSWSLAGITPQPPHQFTTTQDSASNGEFSPYDIAYAREFFIQGIKPSEPEPAEDSALVLIGGQFADTPLPIYNTLKAQDIGPVETENPALQGYMSQPWEQEPFSKLKLIHKNLNISFKPVYQPPKSPSVGKSELIPSLTADLSSRDADSLGDALSCQEHETLPNKPVPFPLHSPSLAMEALGGVRGDVADSIQFDNHWLAESEKPLGPDEHETEPEIEEDMSCDSSDYYWISDHSEPTPKCEEQHPLLQLHGCFLLTCLLSAFDDHYRTHSPKSGLSHSDTASSARKSSAQQEFGGPGQKRARNSDQDSLVRSPGEAVQKKACLTKAEQRRRLWFACPFSKKDPHRHRSCYRNRLSKISYVKQHLSRHHSYPIYCLNCMATFDSEEVRDLHFGARSCEGRPMIQWEAVTEAQKRQLQVRVPPGMSETDQWYIVFDILFPGVPRPHSPFVDSELSEELSCFQDFATAQGPAIITGLLAENGLVSNMADMTAFNDTIVANGLQAIFERYLEARGSQRPLANGTTSTELRESSAIRRDGRPSSTTPAEDQTLAEHSIPPDSRETVVGTDSSDNDPAELQTRVLEPHDPQRDTGVVANTENGAPDSGGDGQGVQDDRALSSTSWDDLSVDDLFFSYVNHPVD